MSIKAKPTVQDILARFNSAMKTAEEAPKLQDDGVLSDPEVDDKEAEIGDEEAAPKPEDDVDELNKNKERGEDAGQVLGSIAKEAADAHYDALMKEAALFGEVFAQAAMNQMNGYSQYDDLAMLCKQAEDEAYANTLDALSQCNECPSSVGMEVDAPDPEDDVEELDKDEERGETAGQVLGATKEAEYMDEDTFFELCKQAADEAYMNTMQAMQPQQPMPMQQPMPQQPMPQQDPVAEEAYDNTLDQIQGGGEASLSDAAEAVSTSAEAALEAAKAAKTLTEAIQEQEEEPEEDYEGSEGADSPEAAQEAYDNTMAYLQQPQMPMQPQPQVEPDPAQEEAYANTMAALQGQG